MKRLLVFDVDGTLITHEGVIPEANLKAINERLAEGDAVAIASGRPFTGINIFLSQLIDGEKYACVANGAAVYDKDGNVLYTNGLKPEDFESFCKRHPEVREAGVPLYCYLANNIGYYEYDWAIDWEIKCNLIPGRDLTKEPFKENDVLLKFMIASKEPSFIDGFKLVEEDLKYRCMRTNPCYLEFVNPGTDKGIAVEFLKQKLKIDNKYVFTFGDQGNDVKMIEDFQGIAMGNAIPACKKVAKYITENCEKDGVASAIYNFVLKMK